MSTLTESPVNTAAHGTSTPARRRRLRTVLGTALGVTAISAASMLTPVAANASSSGWAGADGIVVKGSGLHVDSIEAKVNVFIRKTRDGQFHIWGKGFSYYSARVHLHNESYWHSHEYGHTWKLNRYLPNHSRVCASFGGGQAACETIHS